MMNRAMVGAILLGGTLLAACTSGAPASARLIRTPAATASGQVGATATPAPDPANTSAARAATALPTPNAPSTARTAPNRCPPVVANPVGCPGPLPPQPIVPQGGHARILFCGQLIDTVPIIRGSPALCGAAFRPGESVIVTVTGRMGTSSWQTTAGADGTFRTAVPTATCRLLPGYLGARGNRGSVSNTLPLTLIVCRRLAS